MVDGTLREMADAAFGIDKLTGIPGGDFRKDV
jgi:hypothetical protein